MARTIVIGDVHGCAQEFEELLTKLELKSKDTVIQVGDLINRGPDSLGTIKLAKKHNVSCILGNHEIRLLKAYEEDTAESLKGADRETFNQLTKSDWKFLKKLPLYIHCKKQKTVVVHAGFLPKPAWHKQDAEVITQIRSVDADGNACKKYPPNDQRSWADLWVAPPFVVYGHTARKEVFKRSNSIGIDTGCVFGGHLTAYIVEDQSIVQVPARKKYA